MTAAPTRYVALLRGINLGKARQVDMTRLREVLTARGHGEVRTHLRSGNVVLDSALPEAELAADLSAAIGEEFGFDVPVVVRTGTELAAVVAGDPFATVATDPARYLVTFMAEAARPRQRRRPALPPTAATTWCAGASSISGSPTVSRTRRWPPGSGTGCSAGPGRPATGTPWSASRSSPADPGRAATDVTRRR